MSEWFDSYCSEDWVKEVVMSCASRLLGQNILVSDNSPSCPTKKAIQVCEKHDIEFIFFPSNSTHITQQLYVAAQ
jgi:hypothetical protein